TSGVRTLLGVPMRRERVLIGVIAMWRTEVRAFTDKELALVETFADQAVIAIENTRLLNQLRESLQQQTAPADVLKGLSRWAFALKSVDLESLRCSCLLLQRLSQRTRARLPLVEQAHVLDCDHRLVGKGGDEVNLLVGERASRSARSFWSASTCVQTLVESAARLCDADMGTITRQIDGVFYRAECYGFPAEAMERWRNLPVTPERGSAAGRALLEGRTVHIPDVDTDPDYTFDTAGVRYRSMLGVPMLREGDHSQSST